MRNVNVPDDYYHTADGGQMVSLYAIYFSPKKKYDSVAQDGGRPQTAYPEYFCEVAVLNQVDTTLLSLQRGF